MNIFLNNDIKVLDEGLISWWRKKTTGRDADELEEYKERIANASSKSKCDSIIEDIRDSLKKCKQFIYLATNYSSEYVRSVRGSSGAEAAAAYLKGGAKSDLAKHKAVLEQLLKDAFRKKSQCKE